MAHTTSVYPIKSEADYDAVLEEIAALMDAERETPEGDRLDVLTTLVEAYEARHWPIDLPDPIEAIRIRMEQRGLRARDLEPWIGGRGRVSEILHRKRALTLPMIRRLSEGLEIPAAILVREPRPPRNRTRSPGGGRTRKTSKAR